MNSKSNYIKPLLIFFVFITNLAILVGNQSCKNKEYDNVSKWYGKLMVLPDERAMFNASYNGLKPHEKKIKILSFINGGCGPCVEELKEWKSFMALVDTSDVGFLFLIHSTDIIEDFQAKDSLYINLEYPYYNDNDQRIFKSNNLPENKYLHSFLLDENGKVVLIGNPSNDKMKNLYLKYINKLSAK